MDLRSEVMRKLLTGAAALCASLIGMPVSAQPVGGFQLEQVEAGRAQYNRTCAQCHGRNMVNSGTTIFDLRKFPVDQPERFVASVSNGKGNMPSFKDALTRDQISVLWAYVASRGGKDL